jgi:hypothetical protein
MLAVGLVVATLSAIRDELLLRGVVLRTTDRLLPAWGALLVCGAAGAAARAGVDGALSSAVATEALRGTVLAAVWKRDRGAWMACSASAAWAWCLGPAAKGGLLDVRSAVDLDGGAPAFAVLGVAALAALAWAGRRVRP